MKKNPLLKTPSVLAIAAGALVAGMVFAFALEAFAFVGPTQAPPSGSGAIGSDSSNNVAVGTPTTISGDKFLSLGGTSDNTTYAGKFLENNTTPILLLRDDGAVSIATSTVTAGDTIIGDNLIVGGTLNASGLGASTISAGNVSSGQFGSGTGGGNYSFPGNIGIGTSTPSQPLVVSATGNEKLLLTGGSSQNGMVFDAADGADEFYLYGGASASNGFGIYDVTAGANRMEVLDNGDVGIGTASPSDALVVGTDVGAASGVPASTIMAANPGANSYVEVGQASTNRGRIMWDYNATPANAYMAVGVTNGTNSLVLQDSGGDVGIGTTSPAYLLDVAGTARATTLIDSGLTSQNCVGTNSGGQLIAGTCVVSAISAGNVSSGQFGSGTGGGNYSFPGSVGIGTTTPAYPLDVNGNIHTSVALLLGTSSNGAQLQNNPGTSVSGINTSLLGIAQQGVAWVYALDTSGDLGLAGGLNVHGDVGIGTTSPAYLLDVAGTARATTLIDSGLTSQNCVGTNSGGQLIAGTCVVSAISAGNVSSGQFGSNTGGGNYVFPVQINVGPTTGTNIGINGNQIWSLNNGGSSPLYINYSSTGNTLINENGGDVGIGTGSPGQALEVNGNIEVDGNYLYLGGGSGSVNGTGGPLIYGDLNNTVVKIGSGNGGLLLQNYAGTNVDDLAVSGNSYFNGGDVGIGTTSPGYKLTVTGGSIGGNYGLTPNYASWAAYGTGDGGAGIYNDNNTFKTLMIVGNNSAGGSTRNVGIWDNLTVNGQASAASYCFSGANCISSWPTGNAGTVTSVTAGTGLSGGTITGSGTISVNYGSGSNQAAMGNVTITGPSAGTGLSGGGGSIAVGTGGTFNAISLNLGSANTWTGTQTFTSGPNSSWIGSVTATGGGGTTGFLAGQESGQYWAGTAGQSTASNGVGAYGLATNASGFGGYFTNSGGGYALITGSGNVGIGTSGPTSKLTIGGLGGSNVDLAVNGRIQTGDGSSNGGVWVNNGDTEFMGNDGGLIGLYNSGWGLTLNSSGNVNIAGKLTVGTIDPVYSIDGKNYATYNPAMTGEKEETTGLLDLTCAKGPGATCSTTIDFNTLAQGSDLWLFGKATNLPAQLDSMIVILTPSFDGNTWYTKDAAAGTLTIFGDQAGEVSYRLSAPRFDASQWSNTAPTSEAPNFTIN